MGWGVDAEPRGDDSPPTPTLPRTGGGRWPEAPSRRGLRQEDGCDAGLVVDDDARRRVDLIDRHRPDAVGPSLDVGDRASLREREAEKVRGTRETVARIGGLRLHAGLRPLGFLVRDALGEELLHLGLDRL